MGKPKKKSTKSKKKANIAANNNTLIQQRDNSVEELNNNFKKFTIIEEKFKECKDKLFTDNNFLKNCYNTALILKDLEALNLLSAIKPINELLTFDEIFGKILHIRKSDKEEDKPIKEFLKNIKNVSYLDGQILSENDLVALREEKTKNIPAKQKVKKFKAIEAFAENYPSLVSKKIDYTDSEIQKIIKASEDYGNDSALLGLIAFVKALNSEGEIAAYHYDQAIGYFSTDCQKLETKNLNCSINYLILISKYFRTETSSITDQLIIDFCDKHQTHTKQEIFNGLEIASQYSYQSGYLEDAGITAKLAYDMYVNNIQCFSDNKISLSITFFNLSKTILNLSQDLAIMCLKIAYQYNPNNEITRSAMIKLGLIKGNYNHDSLSNFYNFLIKSNINQLDVSELVKTFNSVPYEDSFTYKVVKIVLDVLQGLDLLAIDDLDKILLAQTTLQNKIDNLLPVISLITKIKNFNWKLYYNHLSNSHKNIFNNPKDIVLVYYKFLLQINNDLIDDAYSTLNNIISTKKDYLDSKFILYYVSAEEIYISTLIGREEISKAKEYLENELHNQDLKSKFLSLLNILEQSEQLANSESEQESRDIKEITSIIDLADIVKDELISSDEEETAIADAEIPFSEEKDIFTNLTPKEIHKYFQHLKTQAIKSNPADKLSRTSEHSWYLENTCIDSQSSGVIKIPNKDNFYALIDPKLLATLDSATANQFHIALEKGFISRKIGQNGIKLLGNNLIELKIKGDIRLYTNEMYKNPNGDTLIIFFKQGTHKDVAREVKKSYIKTIDVESSTPFDFSKIYNEECKQESEEMLFENPSCDEYLVNTIGNTDENHHDN